MLPFCELGLTSRSRGPSRGWTSLLLAVPMGPQSGLPGRGGHREAHFCLQQAPHLLGPAGTHPLCFLSAQKHVLPPVGAASWVCKEAQAWGVGVGGREACPCPAFHMTKATIECTV